MRGKKTALLAAALLLLLLAGCGGTAGGDETDREKVTVAFWSDQLTERYGQYLQESFPQVDFEFYVIQNSTDYYRFKKERGALPDILTVRRFSLRDVADWRDALLDLSDTDLANTFHQSYLRSYTYSDGTMNWLPACAEVDGILLNKTLLAAQGIPVPTNYEEFAAACRRLAEGGIRPFRSNFAADYTCMELLQGLSVARLTSQEGREWRQRYESGQTDRLSEEVWLPVFERMADFIRCAGITQEDLEGDTAGVYDAYRAGETAMIRGTCGEASLYGVEADSVMLPYFGSTENWYLTYPAFQAAASARAEESPERKELILRILEAMLNQEGLQRVAAGENLIAYNRGPERKLSPMLEEMPACLERNLLYIRLASSEMFARSREVVQGMIRGVYPDARSAFDAFNQGMGPEEGPPEAAARVETAYAYAFKPQGGSPAASAVMNSLREELGAELLVGQSVNVAGDIAAGAYTEAELEFLTMGESVDILRCQITGEQLYAYLNGLLTARGKRGCVSNDSTLYVSSGFAMELRRTEEGYAVENLTVDGRKLDREAFYDLAVLGNEVMLQREVLAAAGVTEYQKEERAFQRIISQRLLEGRQLAAPADYITLR